MNNFKVPFKDLPDSIYIYSSNLDKCDQNINQLVKSLAKNANIEHLDAFNVIKIYKNMEKISLLHYDQFMEEPFPKLVQSVLFETKTGVVKKRHYGTSGNYPILHRKELLLETSHPEWEKYNSLTRKLEDLGLFQDTKGIGYHLQWYNRLKEACVTLNGYEVVQDLPLQNVDRHKTAIKRWSLSAPFQTLNKYGYLSGNYNIFDYGCGHGDDLKILEKLEVPASGWDPYFRPDAELISADIVNLGFVLNVIENPRERSETLLKAYGLASKMLAVSVMLNSQSSGGEGYGDGVKTSRNTFQKYFSQVEIKEYLATVLERQPVAVGSGIFYVFKDDIEEQRFLERRYKSTHLQMRSGTYLEQVPKARRLTRTEKEKIFFDSNADVLKTFENDWYRLGRKPLQLEVGNADKLIEVFGSYQKACNYLEKQLDDDRIMAARSERISDLNLYFAMFVFERRKTPNNLSTELRQDIKEFYSNLQDAMVSGQKLLFSAGDTKLLVGATIKAAQAGLGYLNEEEQFQFHVSRFSELEPILKIFVYCGAVLYGDYEQADIIKIHSRTNKITFIKYDDFENTPLPRMVERVKVDLRSQRTSYFSYGEEFPSPYLYNKSKYLTNESPSYESQKRFDESLNSIVKVNADNFGPSPDELDLLLEQQGLRIDGFEINESLEVPDLGEKCGENFTFQDLISAGETFKNETISNVPAVPETYLALRQLAKEIIDPVISYFGEIELTYGFCSRQLAAKIPGRIDPRLDQHASCEVNTKGNLICARKGAAVDFIVQSESMLEVAQWIVENTNFDRMYFYADDRPLHVSIGPENKKEVVFMKRYESGKSVPKVIANEKFLSFTTADLT
jgi:DNA phosphorothioation-associated putative methyltransferase